MTEYDKINFANKVLMILKETDKKLNEYVERYPIANTNEVVNFHRQIGFDAYSKIRQICE